MKRVSNLIVRLCVGSTLAVAGGFFSSVLFSSVTAEEIGYVEEYALAQDRALALQQLIPGTEDYYYYHCLHYQSLEQYDRVEQLLQAWIKRHQETPRVREIQNRQALLTYGQTPQKSLDYLKRVLNLQFNHQRETVGARPDLPTELDAARITRERLLRDALAAHKNLDGFEDAALDWLVATELSAVHRRHLLQRLRRPDYPNLVALVLDDLKHSGSKGFGSLPIHGMLLLSQLEECLRLKPDLLNQSKFVTIYLSKLRPNDDIDLQRDMVARQAHLDRLWSFVERLAPAHNSLKAHVLYHRLQFDRERGIYDKPRFMAYIQLPRSASYANREYIERTSMRRYAVDLNSDYRSVTLLAPVGNDEPLVQNYLHHFFLTEMAYGPYEPYLDDTYLKHAFAETKILNGLGDAEQWSSWLPPEKYQQLKQRVDIDFAPTNRKVFSRSEPVRIDLNVKNVPTLIVKVYEINASNFYRQNRKEVNTDVNLDGLVANVERTYEYGEPALRRVARHFEFPEMAEPGVYVVDFIGNGRSSRAVIRKGQLQYLARTSTAGHVVTVLDEDSKKLQEASVWLAGHEYQADDDGLITVPFSTRPGRQQIVLSSGRLSTLDSFEHAAEAYQLQAGIYVDRESLLSRKSAEVLVRPSLFLNGSPVTLSVLESVRLMITSTDLDGIATTKEVNDFKLFEDRESVYTFLVPERLATIHFTVSAKVESRSQSKKVDLSASNQFQLNGIDRTDKVEDLHLLRPATGYVLELLGKTGETRVDRPVQVSLKHRDFKAPIHVSLRSDAQGQVQLGALAGVQSVTAVGPSEISRTWTLRRDRHSHYATLHGREGESITVPYMGSSSKKLRAELSCLELRGNQFLADRYESLAVADGVIVLSDLPRGDYDLFLKRTNQHVRVKIAAGEVDQGYVLGSRRQLEVHTAKPLQITRATVADGQLEVKVSGASEWSRVHLFATRYEPTYDVYGALGSVRDRELITVLRAPRSSLFAAGRKLGDEYRYIIDRKYAHRYPGNMLERPSLLLNPWAVRQTETGTQKVADGEEFAPAAPPSDSRRGGRQSPGQGRAPRADSPNLDFLATGTAVHVNLRPDEEGVIAINCEDLSDYQRVWVVAVDPRSTVCRAVSLPAGAKSFVDLRLQQGLDPKKHFTQQKQVSVIGRGQTFTLADVSTARFETFDSLTKVHSLMVTLSNNATLIEFGFVLNWDQLTDQQKREKYSKYACHELSFFLSQKDPEFFEAVVLPHVRNKRDKTFVDRWLLGDSLQDYVAPWAFSQLNTAERVLLARHVAEEMGATRRLVNEQYDVVPVNTDLFNLRFDTAVNRSALSADDGIAREFGKRKSGAVSRRALTLSDDSLAGSNRNGSMAGRGGRGTEAGGEGAEFDAYAGKAMDKKSESVSASRRSRSSKVLAKGLAEKEEMDRAGAYSYFSRDLGRLGAVRQLYRQVDKTQEWAENNYYRLPIEQQTAELIQVNGFWQSFVNSDPEEPFLSTRFAETTGSFAEMMLALAVLDLPARSGEHEVKSQDLTMTLVAADAMVAFHEEIREAKVIEGDKPVLVSQNFFRQGDRYRYEGNQKADKYVTDEFLIQTVYGCQVVVTNPTSAPQKLDVLLQVPLGAIPVLNGKATRSQHTDLQPFHTVTMEYFFYFPASGDYEHYPVHVSRNEQLLAFAPPVELHVVQQLSKFDRKSWAFLSQNGSQDDVLGFLRSENLQRIDVAKIAFRMQDRAFCQEVLALLAKNHVYHPVLWSYAIKHDVPQEIGVYLEHQGGFVSQCGLALDSPLLQFDPVARKTYQHLDYRPLVNARAHQLGRRRQIVNGRFLQQYHGLLNVLSYYRTLSDEQWMAVTYYLLLQDRVEEAIAAFKRVNPDKLATRLQYDYFAAYLDFFTEDPQLAGPIAEKYANYGVDRWRRAFEAIAAQLAEIEGQQTKAVDADDRQQSQTELAATEPEFDFTVEARKVRINFQNLGKVRVNYYLMDIELLFSRNPFVQQYSGQFSTIRPNQSSLVELPKGESTHQFDLPKELSNSNVLVEVEGAGKTRSQAYYANSLSVQIVENYGQVRVVHDETRSPLSKVYVKVYARMTDGSIKFYKDGYTDLRGRFDYTSLSTNELDAVQKFSLLICSDDHGAVVREATPPKR